MLGAAVIREVIALDNELQRSLTTLTLVPKNSRKSCASVNPEPTKHFAWFWMYRAMAGKSGSSLTTLLTT